MIYHHYFDDIDRIIIVVAQLIPYARDYYRATKIYASIFYRSLNDLPLLLTRLLFLINSFSTHEITYVFTMVYASTCIIEIRVNLLLHATVYDFGDCAKAPTNGSL